MSFFVARRNTSVMSDFITSFPATENPISQGGIWTLGGTHGLDWQNVQTSGGTPGAAYGTGVSDTTPIVLYNDNIATLQGQGFTANKHWVEIIVRADAGYTPAAAHEIEILLGFSISANQAKGYELDFTLPLGFARWNGAMGDFSTDVFTTISGGTFTPADGDRVRAEFDSSGGSPVITVYSGTGAVGDGLAGLTQRWQVTDTTAGKIATGYPGQGHFYRPGINSADFIKRSIKGFGAGSL